MEPRPVFARSDGEMLRSLRVPLFPADVHQCKAKLQEDERIGMHVRSPDDPQSVAEQKYPKPDLSPPASAGGYEP